MAPGKNSKKSSSPPPDLNQGSSNAQPAGAGNNSYLSPLKVELPPFFVENGTEAFSVWCRRLEVALDALPMATPIDMVKLLPSRLSGAAFNYWDNLAPAIKNNYPEAKACLTKVNEEAVSPFRVTRTGRKVKPPSRFLE
ncbi:uncharacterized protein LOC117118449 [Anneissia japonica]|uniref:uncharacterized protein LOC117118449 n=1 Tax=Anneissia japonica TaxID=1529436 RepID=UPI00142569C3|nr:uncharacterized protein LOC117118449 [Anneissia japonica]